MNKAFFKDGLHFECTMCGKCCKGEGIVALTEQELENIATFFRETKEFIKEKYVLKMYDKKYWLKDHVYRGEKACIFFYGKCVIYPVRPVQCRTYPFWPTILSSEKTWDAEEQFCEGINKGKKYSYEEIIDNVQKMLENR